MARLGLVIDNKYEILKEIGRGGMSTVYLAMDKRLNKQWAVKEIKKIPGDKNNRIEVNSLILEANMMKKLDHPSLPRVVDIIENDNTIYVIMDYIEGETMKAILETEGAQSQKKVIKWAKELCEVLHYLHSQNPPIIYRDMKPSNVMVKPEGNIKLIDFGIAREYKEDNIADTISLGTRGYAAPEQFGGKGQTDARTDIFCLGVTLYHLVTGKNPAEPPYEMYPIRKWNPSLSSGLEAIITKCTQFNPEDRFQNCDELMYALEHYNELDETYKKKQKKKFRIFLVCVFLSIFMFTVGIICKVLETSEKNKNYDELVNISPTTDYEKKVTSYISAIELYKYKYDAYIKLLEAYTENNMFGDEESAEFMKYYNAAFYNKDSSKFDTEDEGYAEMNFVAGITYLYLYDMDNTNVSFKVRALKAYSFFEAVILSENTQYKNYAIAESYYTICKFYKDYVANSANIKEPTQDIYIKLLDSLTQCISNLDEYENENMPYIRLTVYEAVSDLLYGQRKGLVSTGVEYDMVIDILEDIKEDVYNLSVTQEKSIDKQNKIISNLEMYLEDILRSYKAVEEK